MIGILIQLILSWILLWVFERKSILALGLQPTGKRVGYLCLFFLLAGIISSSDYVLKMLIAKQRWILSDHISFVTLWEGIWWNIKSVLFEELIFRGAIFYILFKRLGAIAAIIISSVSFGIYHWYSHEVIGQPFAMLVTFLTTGLMGAIYAFSFVRTSTIYAPIGIHLGWNIIRSVVFSDTIIGDQLFVEIKPAPVIQVSYFQYYILIFAPLFSVLIITFLVIRNLKQQPIA